MSSLLLLQNFLTFQSPLKVDILSVGCGTLPIKNEKKKKRKKKFGVMVLSCLFFFSPLFFSFAFSFSSIVRLQATQL
jgi:hypothetical protein